MAMCVSVNSAAQELNKMKKSIECVDLVDFYNVVLDAFLEWYLR